MAVTVSRPKSTTAAKGAGSGRQPAQKNVTTDQPTQGALGDLVFNVTHGEVPTARRGGREATVVIPPTVLNAFDAMITSNPRHDNDSMDHVGPVTLTNKQIQQWLVQGLTKMVRRDSVPAEERDVEYVSSSITTAPGSPNPRSADKDDADKKVTIVWTVRMRSDAEVIERRAAKARRQAERESQN